MAKSIKPFITTLLFLIITLYSSGQESFTFIQLSDPQFGMSAFEKEDTTINYYQNDTISLKNAIDKINKLAPDFVVVCGDFVQDASEKTFNDFKKIMTYLNAPYYLVPGNHDIGSNPNQASIDFYKEHFGVDYFNFVHKGHAFIFTNSLLWTNKIEKLSKKHHKWFVNSLNTSKKNNENIFIIGHYPIFTEKANEDDHYFNIPLKTRKQILKLMHKNKVSAYLSGHKHEYIENKYKGMLFVTGESNSFNFNDLPLGFRLWQVSKNEIKQTFIPIE